MISEGLADVARATVRNKMFAILSGIHYICRPNFFILLLTHVCIWGVDDRK